MQCLVKFCLIFFLFTRMIMGWEIKQIEGPLSLDLRLMDPEFSPDGQYLSASGPGYDGIYIYDFRLKNWHRAVDDAGAGYGHRWSVDAHSIIYRGQEYIGHRRFFYFGLYDLNNQKNYSRLSENLRDVSPPVWLSSMELGFIDQDDLKTLSLPDRPGLNKTLEMPASCLDYHGKGFLIRKKKIDRCVVAEERVILNLQLPPQEKFIVWQELGKGMVISQLDSQQEIFSGNYEMPAWSPDGNYIVMVKTQDDGHRYLSGELCIYDTRNAKLEILSKLNDYIPGNPAWSPSGTQIVFEDLNTQQIYLIDIQN